MRSGWLEDAVKASRFPPLERFPRDMENEADDHLKVCLVKMPQLTSDKVRDWLADKHVQVVLPAEDRKIHGCMVANKDCGFIFWDSQDDANVRRFTVAHEVAHFVLDHQMPRLKAIAALGEDIVPVLNGKKEPNVEQGLSAMFKRIPLAQVKLMDRGPSGAICLGAVDASEHRADRLAFELLAPADRALPLLQDRPREAGISELASQFGLHLKQARTYARILIGPEHRPFSIRKYFDEEEE